MAVYKVNGIEIVTKSLKKESSSVHQIGYSEELRMLVVVFKRGDAYSYHPIMPEVYKNLSESQSIGADVAANIIRNPRVTSQKIQLPKDETKTLG